MKHCIFLIALLIMPLITNAQQHDSEVVAVRLGLIINSNEFSTDLEAKYLELYDRHGQMYLQEISVSPKLSIQQDKNMKEAVQDYFNSEAVDGAVRINDEIELTEEQSCIVESLIALSKKNIPLYVSNAPEFVFVCDGTDHSAVMENICDTASLYKALTTNNRRTVRRTLRDLNDMK